MEAELVPQGDGMRLRLRSVESDGTPRDFYDTLVRITSPGMEPVAVRLDQVAPGTYEVDLGTLDAGAYAMRFDQTRSGASPLGRTVVLVAPTPAEYRLLGTNERLLAALREATGGTALAGEDAARRAWRHDLAGTTAGRELWPWLLLAALLLWPLDVGVRRLSVGRRDLALARAWVGARWVRARAPAPWETSVDLLLGARDRAAGRRTRGSLVSPGDAPATTGVGPADRPADQPPTAVPSARPTAPAPTPSSPSIRATATPSPPPAPSAAPPAAPPAGGAPAPTPDQAADSMARLRDAKRRARR